MSTDYRALLEAVPETVARAVAGLTGAAVDPSREPVASSRSSVTATDVRIDVVTEIFGHLHRAIVALEVTECEWGEFPPALPGEDPESPVVKPNAEVPVVPVWTDRPETAARHAAKLTRVLADRLDDVESHPLGYHVTDHLDELRSLVRTGTAKPARPRKCPVCFIGDVHADLDHASGVCSGCEAVVRVEVWLTVGQAAERLGVTRKTITRWVEADAVLWRDAGRARQVELKSCQEHQEMTRHRRVLNLAPNVP